MASIGDALTQVGHFYASFYFWISVVIATLVTFFSLQTIFYGTPTQSVSATVVSYLPTKTTVSYLINGVPQTVSIGQTAPVSNGQVLTIWVNPDNMLETSSISPTQQRKRRVVWILIAWAIVVAFYFYRQFIYNNSGAAAVIGGIEGASMISNAF